MDDARILELRKQIAAKRGEFSCIKSFQRLAGMVGALEREDSPEAKAFLETITEYIRLCEALVREQAAMIEPEKEKASPLIAYAVEASLDPDYEGGDMLLPLLLSYRIGSWNWLEGEEEHAYLLLAIVNFYKRGDRPWRGKFYAVELKGLLEDKAFPKQIYDSLGAFYKVVMDYRSAKDVALSGYRALFEKPDTRSDAAFLYRDALACSLYLQEKDLPSNEEILERFGALAGKVLDYARFASMKLDPVMNTPKFQSVYDEVMEEAQNNYEEFKVKSPLSLWFFMEEGFAKHDIHWSSPATLNPSMRFD